MEDARALGRMIRESRLKRGMSLSQLASEVGRSSSSVRRWERGEVPPAKSVMPQLAAILEVDPQELDALRPGPLSDTPSDDGSATGPSTIEQPAIPVDGEVDAGPVPAATASERGVIGDFAAAWRSLTEDWTGWIRGLATAGVLLVLLIVLVWAAGELFGALADVWDSFDAGTN